MLEIDNVLRWFPGGTGALLTALGSIAAVGYPAITLASVPPQVPLRLAQAPASIAPRSPRPDRPDLQPLPSQQPAPTLPKPLETPPTPTPTPTPALPIPATTVQIQQINFLGNTAFSAAQLSKVVESFIGKQASFEDLLSIRAKVTDFYTSNGYKTSGAFLPRQDISTGIITIQVVEGQLERIEIQGLRRLRQQYVRSRVALAAGPPLNIGKLEQALQLLQLDPLLRSVQAELTPGTTPGQSILTLTLKESPALHAALIADNWNSPSTGSTGESIGLEHGNLLGFGDLLEGGFSRTDGTRNYRASYELPINAHNGTLSLRYVKNDSDIIEPPFSVLDINSNSQTVSVGIRQPLVRTPTSEFALGLSLDLRQSQTFLLKDIPFSFTRGPDNGKSRLTVLRFSQDWLNRSPKRVLAARSQFSLGLNAFDATINDTGTDGRFFSWVGQFQYVQALSRDIIAIARITGQFTPNSLLPLEQFSIGGVDTVRGYRQNQQVSDNGIAASVEIRVPIVRDRQGASILQVVPFFDLGKVWGVSETVLSPGILASVGLGLRLQLKSGLEARLDYGIPLSKIPNAGDSLQDKGLLFSLKFQPF